MKQNIEDNNNEFKLLPILDDVLETQSNEDQENQDVEEQEETVEQEETDDVDETEESEDTEDVESEEDETASAFYENLVSRNILQEGLDIKNWDDLDTALDQLEQDLPKKVEESILNRVPEKGKLLMEYVLTKGASLTTEDLESFYKEYLEEINESEITDVNKAREVLKKVYSGKFDDDTIEIMLDSLEDKGTLLDKANAEKPNKVKQIIESTKEEVAQKEQDNVEYVQNINNAFEDFTWAKSHKEKIHEQLFSGKTEKLIQEIAKKPKALVELANLLSYYDPKKETFNIETFVNQVNTKKVNSLKETVKAKMGNSQTSTKANKKQETLIPVF